MPCGACVCEDRGMPCKKCQDEAKGAADGAHEAEIVTVEDRLSALEQNQAELVHLAMTSSRSSFERVLLAASQIALIALVSYRVGSALGGWVRGAAS